jgi:hypothetical protein
MLRVLLLLLPEWRAGSCHMLLDCCCHCCCSTINLLLLLLTVLLHLPTRHITLLLALAAAAVSNIQQAACAVRPHRCSRSMHLDPRVV